MLKKIFSLDNPVFDFLGKIADIVILNLIWLLFSLPIVTLGASTTALYQVIYEWIQGQDTNLLERFWAVFKKKFVIATKIWMLFLIAGFLLSLNIYFWLQFEGLGSVVILALHFSLLFIYLMVGFYICPTINNETKLEKMNVKAIIKTSFWTGAKQVKVTLYCFFVFVCFLVLNFTYVWINLAFVLVGTATFVFIVSLVQSKIYKENHNKE